MSLENGGVRCDCRKKLHVTWGREGSGVNAGDGVVKCTGERRDEV